MFQFHHLLPEFTALENVEMPLRIARRAARPRRGRGPRRCSSGSASASGSTHRPGHAVGRRAAARGGGARAGRCSPALLLADEPTGDLDEHTADALHALLREMHAEHGLTSIIATHNPRLAAPCDRVLRLEDGACAAAA